MLYKNSWTDQYSKCLLNASSARGRIIILNFGSANGWVPGALLLSAKEIIKDCNVDYQEEITGELFQKSGSNLTTNNGIV